jgi:uncharacterized protein (UPF0276 family)
MKPLARGLGLRREFAAELCAQPKRDDVDFLEVVPDNWMDAGGDSAAMLDNLAAKYPFVAHGLSLSIGDALPLDQRYLGAVQTFLARYQISLYSDHLSLSRDERGYLYDLIPMPRTRGAIDWVAGKIGQVQDRLSRQLVLENISFYHQEPGEMPEAEFIAEVVARSGCGILLDVNNLYVNARNHGSDPQDLLRALPADAVVYYHLAGHLDPGADERVLDTHGAPVAAAVLALGRAAVARFGPRPLVLERDNNVPPLATLCHELNTVRRALAPPRQQQKRAADACLSA